MVVSHNRPAVAEVCACELRSFFFSIYASFIRLQTTDRKRERERELLKKNDKIHT